MPQTFVVYVDESGDEGFSFGRGSSEWFVLSAVITRRVEDLQLVKLVDEVRVALGKPERKPLHFRDLRHEHRLPFVDKIANAPLRSISVCIRKPSILEPEKFHERFRLYFYGARYLLERVSWYCRDRKGPRDLGDGSAALVLSNRSGMSCQELRQYLRLLKTQSDAGHEVRVDWSAIKPERVTALRPGGRAGLQVADAVAGSFYYALERSRHGFTEDRYARMLKPVVYKHQGRYLGYGLKFWPEDWARAIGTEGRFGWLWDVYR